MKKIPSILPLFFATTLTLLVGLHAEAQQLNKHDVQPKATLLASGLKSLFGTAVGPDGALYVAEGETGSILRIDPRKGQVSTFASGLPAVVPDGGGPIDVAFIGRTAYVLVTVVDEFVGGNSVDGIYRVDGPHSFTVVADIGKFAADHPPKTAFDLPTGLQFALEPYRGGFVVTDGHHNRVYYVTLQGQVSELIAFDDIVPTGLALHGKTIYMAEAGPIPHLPENGKIVSFTPGMVTAVEIASGAPLLVDVELGPGNRLFALAQGQFPDGGQPGQAALPNTGSLVVANKTGNLQAVVTELNQPTAFEFIADAAYVVTLAGEIWKIDKLAPRQLR